MNYYINSDFIYYIETSGRTYDWYFTVQCSTKFWACLMFLPEYRNVFNLYPDFGLLQWALLKPSGTDASLHYTQATGFMGILSLFLCHSILWKTPKLSAYDIFLKYH